MNESSYEEYKRNSFRERKKSNSLHQGKSLLLLGVVFAVYLLWILPFHADNVSEVRGDEVEAGRQYYPQKVYYIEDMRILHVKTDTSDGGIYAVVAISDCDGNEWIISLTPGNSERLTEQLELAGRFADRPGPTVSGYFQLQYLEELPFEADSFYSVYGRSYADDEGRNMLGLNAKYLCDRSGNYTLEMLLHPGIPLVSLVAALSGIFYGGFLVIRNRSRRKA
ncbi:MAG: hypothetical protein NC337_01800 [Roseburia sp.]|nr:hypothetical protein [Roseburia sp.]